MDPGGYGGYSDPGRRGGAVKGTVPGGASGA